jgi:hypothetical protein
MLRRLVLASAVTLVAGAAPALAQSCDTRFTVVNQSQIAINEFYFSPSSSNGWGNDRFGNGVLPGGQQLEMDTGAPGAHDFKAVAANGAALELRNVDICRISRVIINPVGVFLAE